MSQSRINNTLRNSIVGIGSYALTSLLAFVSRSVFIHTLGVAYLGISGLYTNILSMLALSDLGVNTVMVYSLYKPLAENDTVRITALMRYFQKLYLTIAAVVAALGIACVPFLQYIIKDSGLPHNELNIYYLLTLANSVCSYLAISKSTLIRADQHFNIIQGITAITNAVLHLLQIGLLLIYKNYVLFLVLPIAVTLANNLILSHIADRKYPYLKMQNGEIDVETSIKREITTNLKATFFYKLGATIINSTDNILISVLLGTVMVGYYSNYYTVVILVNTIIGIVVNSVLASIGNFNATQSKERKFELFKQMLLIFYFTASFCAASYLAVFDDFVSIWLGMEYVLDDVFLIALVINVTVACISNPLWMTREASGVFVSVRYVMLAAAAINIVLSVALAQIMGLAGIILATAIARCVTLFWYEPQMLCRKVFQVPVKIYWAHVAKLFAALLLCAGAGWVFHRWPVNNLGLIAVKLAACAIISVITFWLFFCKTQEMQKLVHIIRRLTNQKIKGS